MNPKGLLRIECITITMRAHLEGTFQNMNGVQATEDIGSAISAKKRIGREINSQTYSV
jgi:hypothetical protein